MKRPALLFALVLAASPARADDKDVAAREAFRLGQLDETQNHYDEALAHYREVLRIDPGNWFAGTAKARVDALSPYAGAFAELAELDSVRKSPQRSSDLPTLDGLAAHREGWATSRVKLEAAIFLSGAYLRLGGKARGIELGLAAARDPSADPALREAAWDLAWSAMDLDRAVREVDASAPPSIVGRLRRDLRRRVLHRASYVATAVGSALLIVAAVVAVRRKRIALVTASLFRPLTLVFLAAVPLVGMLIAEEWEHGAGRPFVSFGLAMVAIHALVAASRGAFGDRARPRTFGAIVAAACVLAAAYLVLERAEAGGMGILSDFGL